MNIEEAFQRISSGTKNIRWWKHLIVNIFGKLLLNVKDASSVFEDEWQSLIILDDCRFDALKALYGKRYSEEVQIKISRG